VPVLSLVKALSLGAKKVRPSYEFLSARQGLDLVGSADTPSRRASDSATAMALRASEWRGQRLAAMAPPPPRPWQSSSCTSVRPGEARKGRGGRGGGRSQIPARSTNGADPAPAALAGSSRRC